jgi:LEA14-like dessication related protein
MTATARDRRPSAGSAARAASSRSLAALLVVAVALLAGGCAAVVPKLETPTLQVVGVELLDAQFAQQRFTVTMRVQNPNDRELPIRGLSYTMQLGGQEFGSGQSNKAFTVPALGEAEFDMTVTTNLATTLLKILPKLEKNPESLDYRLTGRVETGWTFLRTIPFTETGRLSMK